MKNNKGFSLVELIVVIAIMAILAAVAVIGVSVYIPKAQEQADNSTLDMLSDSFMAACLSVGVDHREVDASFEIDENGNLKQDTLKISGSVSSYQKEDIRTMLLATITGEKVSFNMPNGAAKFIATVEGRFGFASSAVKDKQTYDNFWAWDNQLDAYKGSAFNNIDTEELLENVNEIIDQVAGKVNPLEVAGFREFYESIGGDPNDASEENQKKMMDALVLYAANVAANGEGFKDTVIDYIDNPSSIDKNDANNNVTQDFLAAEAVRYAVGMAWIHELEQKLSAEAGNNAKFLIIAFNNEQVDRMDYKMVTNAVNAGEVTVQLKNSSLTSVQIPDLGDDLYFRKWYNTQDSDGKTKGEKAIEGYMAAMGIIDQNQGEIELGNGYGDYADVIDGLLGKTQSE